MNIFRRLFNRSSQSRVPTKPEGTPEAAPSAPPPAQESVVQPEAVGTDTLPVAEDLDPTPVPSPADGATRPLAPEAVISTQNEHLIFGQSTDVGMVRTNNQDSALSFFFTSHSAEERPDFGLFVVADGMGGHHDGEKASAITTRVIAAQMTNNFYLPMLAGENGSSHPTVTDAMISAVQKANAAVIEHVPEGGTTVTAVAIVEDLAHVVHVGDSRLYLITKDGIEQITRDHSLVQRLIELDQITSEEAAEHPQKNVLYRALGQSDTVEVDAQTRRLPPNSRLLLCSDGLWGQVNDSVIYETVTAHSNPQEACDKLISLANAHGGIDNITAILLRLPSS
jgi:serine/threonine protein phosphatase PrpC